MTLSVVVSLKHSQIVWKTKSYVFSREFLVIVFDSCKGLCKISTNYFFADYNTFFYALYRRKSLYILYRNKDVYWRVCWRRKCEDVVGVCFRLSLLLYDFDTTHVVVLGLPIDGLSSNAKKKFKSGQFMLCENCPAMLSYIMTFSLLFNNLVGNLLNILIWFKPALITLLYIQTFSSVNIVFR